MDAVFGHSMWPFCNYNEETFGVGSAWNFIFAVDMSHFRYRVEMWMENVNRNPKYCQVASNQRHIVNGITWTHTQNGAKYNKTRGWCLELSIWNIIWSHIWGQTNKCLPFIINISAGCFLHFEKYGCELVVWCNAQTTIKMSNKWLISE